MDEPFSRLGSFRLVLSLMNVLEWKEQCQAQYPIHILSIVDRYVLICLTITSSFARPASSKKDPKAQEMQKMKVWKRTIAKISMSLTHLRAFHCALCILDKLAARGETLLPAGSRSCTDPQPPALAARCHPHRS